MGGDLPSVRVELFLNARAPPAAPPLCSLRPASQDQPVYGASAAVAAVWVLRVQCTQGPVLTKPVCVYVCMCMFMCVGLCMSVTVKIATVTIY